MIRKILATSIILAASSSIAFALSAPYVGIASGVTTNTSKNSNFRGVPGTFFAGFGADFSQMYVAGEVFATVGTLSIDNNTGASDIKTSYGYGVSIIPGLELSEHTMAYGRAGLVRTRFSSSSTTVSGGQLGVGLQTSLTQCWDVRGEYNYTSYSKVSNVSPKSDQFIVGLVYKFE